MAAQTLLPAPVRRAPRGARDGCPYPFVSERQFDRRNRRHADLPLSDAASGLPVAAVNYLQESTLAEAIAAMRLRPLDRRVLELRADGMPIREVAERLGVSKARVEHSLRRIRRRFRARHAAPSNGWQEVYLDETRRVGK